MPRERAPAAAASPRARAGVALPRARLPPRRSAGRWSPTTPPTMRVTTATLKKTCAARIGPDAPLVAVGEHGQECGRDHDRRQHERNERRGRATTSGPRNRKRPIAQASGSPAISVSAVDAARLPDREPDEAARVPAEEREARPLTSGHARGWRRGERRRRARGTPPGGRSWRPGRRASAQDVSVSTRRSSGRGWRRSPRRAGRTARSGTRRTCGRPGEAAPSPHREDEHALRESFWNRSVSMKSIKARAPFSFFAPRRTPANSICRKHVEATAAVGAVFGGVVANMTSAGGLVAYETTIGLLPLLPPAPENCAV